MLEAFKRSLISPLPPMVSPHRVEKLWQFPLSVSAEAIWPFLIDTSKMNKELGLPPWNETTVNGELHATSMTLGKLQEWVEKPWIWQQERELQNHRIFSKGWMTEQRGVFTVEPTAQGCTVSIYFCWGFRSLLGQIIFSLVAPVLQKKFTEFFRQKQILIQNPVALQTPTFLIDQAETRKALSLEKQEALKQEFRAEGVWTETLGKFIAYLLQEDDLDLDRVHLKKVAPLLGVDLQELFAATGSLLRHGYLSLTWDVICPHCRGATATEAQLAQISAKNNCEACKVDFSLDAEESVEIVFHLTDRLRSVKKQIYCAAEPAKKKHIKLFQLLPARGKRTFALQLPVGRYRLRAQNSEISMAFDISESATCSELTWNPQEAPSEKPQVQPSFSLTLENPLSIESFYTLEETWWHREHLFPGEVLSSPALREFFSKDHLAAGVKLNVGHQVLVFTDIVGSTPLYREVGDARAFTLVQKHYGEIGQIITAQNGVVVKFIGDAVMAAFLDLDSAFQACLEIHQKFSLERADSPIRLRISLHRGPVLCANLNVGLDYFGTTVNNAAKIQKWAGAHQIAILPEIWDRLQGKFSSKISLNEVHDDSKLGLKVHVLSLK